MKFRLLLHYYQDNNFIGHSFPEVEVEDFNDLQAVISSVFPGSDVMGIPMAGSVYPPLKPLKHGYGAGTNVRVMQVMPTVENAQHLDLALAGLTSQQA